MADYTGVIADFAENPQNSDDPKLVGYLPIEFFTITDYDRSSRRIRDVSISVDLLLDFNVDTGTDAGGDWGV